MAELPCDLKALIWATLSGLYPAFFFWAGVAVRSEKEPFADFRDHYNAALSKCFIEIGSTDYKTDPGTIFTSKIVGDAYEGKIYAEYMWHSDKVKKYWEVPPVECHALSLSGEKQTCHSDDEFSALVKKYME